MTEQTEVSPDENLRLSCVYAASNANSGEKSVDQIVADAQKLFDFIRGNDKAPQPE